jgi:DNA-binding XRE family transcriptional regulator
MQYDLLGVTKGRTYHKLSEADVRDIRLILEAGIATLDEIGNAVGVSRTTIAHIRDGKTWQQLN